MRTSRTPSPQIWRGDAENDGFNRLILAAGLSWRQVAMLRGYCKYLLQIGVPFSQTYVEETLAATRCWRACWSSCSRRSSTRSPAARARPRSRPAWSASRAQLQALASGDEAALAALEPVIDARAGKRDAQVEATRNALKGLLDRVASLDEDRILRSFIGVIDATLRTSYYSRRRARRRRPGRLHQLQVRLRRRCRTCRSRVRTARSSSTARAWKACTCASARSRAAACAGRIAARTSAPKCWAWSRRRW